VELLISDQLAPRIRRKASTRAELPGIFLLPKNREADSWTQDSFLQSVQAREYVAHAEINQESVHVKRTQTERKSLSRP